MKLKDYHFYFVGGKYPKFIGGARGTSKRDAFETLKLIRGFSDKLFLGKKVRGYIVK